MISFDQFKAKAMDTFRVKGTESGYKDPISFLYSLSWNIPNGVAFSEEKVAEMNIGFDDAGCFGRALKAAVLCEQFFPTHTMYAGEVCEDLLRSMILEQACAEKWNDETYIAELLQYESPHIVIVDEQGRQFDPIFAELSAVPTQLSHPSVGKLDLWKGLYCSYLVSQALSYRTSNVRTYQTILEEAFSVYPEMILVKENLASMYCLIGQYEKSIHYAKEASQKRKDAKILMFLYMMTDDEVYKTEIIEQYDKQMFHFLTKMFTP
ncbi:MAG: hypothetical protein KBB91_00015 [Candidatus Pacebacteria bacterium]|nr:hypothetical protein [Candidatus Paceibacterota bacterium]MBP9700780.1 hypothetical protein [Candidatus Paceibacterota bacterium]